MKRTTIIVFICLVLFLLSADYGSCRDLFYIGPSYPTAHIPLWCRAADIDGDLDQDIIIATVMSGIEILENDGDGSFQHHSTLGLGSWYIPVDIEVVDLDNDNDKDIVVAVSHNEVCLSVFLNVGNGSFQGRQDS